MTISKADFKAEKEQFKSTDLSLVAAILATKKAELTSVQQLDLHMYQFSLFPSEVCFQLKNDYINDKLVVSAKAIADNIRLLKSLMKGS